MTSTVAIVGQLAAVTISFIVGLFLLKKYVPKVNNVGECKKGIIHWARDVRPFFVMTVIGLLDAQCGIYALRLFSEVREIGYFQVALQVVNLVVIGLNSVNLPLQPRLSQSWSVGNLDEVRRLLERGVVLSSAAALLGGAVIFGGAEVVVRVFGDEYLGAANVMRLMVVGQMFNALSGSCAMLHIAAGRQAVVTRALFVAFLSNGLLGLILVPLYGAMGAAVASAFSLMIWNISLAYKAWVEYGINTSIFGKQFKLS